MLNNIYPRHLKRGLKHGYPICCIMYFQYAHSDMNKFIKELQYATALLGIVRCPDCIVSSLL